MLLSTDGKYSCVHWCDHLGVNNHTNLSLALALVLSVLPWLIPVDFFQSPVCVCVIPLEMI